MFSSFKGKGILIGWMKKNEYHQLSDAHTKLLAA
jgi:hypothetical protein